MESLVGSGGAWHLSTSRATHMVWDPRSGAPVAGITEYQPASERCGETVVYRLHEESLDTGETGELRLSYNQRCGLHQDNVDLYLAIF